MLPTYQIKERHLKLQLPNKISKYVSSKELVKSKTAIRNGIDNSPTWEHYENAKNLCYKIFDNVREHYGVPIYISSFYRSNALNEKIKGSNTSQHCTGEAMDLDADVFGKITNSEIFHYIKDNLNFDQLIWEYGDETNPDWVHVSLTRNENRKEVLIAYKEDKETKYKPWT